MSFSSVFFLFFFLPVALFLYFVMGRSCRNPVLLLISLIFYAWGENVYVLLMTGSVAGNYLFGRMISESMHPGRKKSLLILAILFNLLPLLYFKYSAFFLHGLHTFFPALVAGDHPDPHLPIGISFFTFQALSYVIDVFRGISRPQKNIFDLGLYVALFPQLIAGPIVRYHDIARQLRKRAHTVEGFASGVERFIFGLSKKMLLANPLGELADTVFALSSSSLSLSTAWLGVVSYSLQIYFDFSGYSDMAIGLGRMFGFTFPENFNYPYISRSVREFWRRWHISLSCWFRDYLYIPLGGSRCGSLCTYRNLLLVFLLCGLWHGANWTFVVWGLFHGLFLAVEHGWSGRSAQTVCRPWLQHVYMILFICNSWVFFRADSVAHAFSYLHAMYDATSLQLHPLAAIHLDAHFISVFLIATLLAMPVYPSALRTISLLLNRKMERMKAIAIGGPFVRVGSLGLLLVSCAMSLAAGSYNPFIYFRF